MVTPEYGPDGQRIWASPELQLCTNIGELSLTWFNTRIRLFGDEFAHVNHIEWRDGERVRGLNVGKEIIDLLLEMDYPRQYDYYPDEATVNWFVNVCLNQLQSEIEQ